MKFVKPDLISIRPPVIVYVESRSRSKKRGFSDGKTVVVVVEVSTLAVNRMFLVQRLAAWSLDYRITSFTRDASLAEQQAHLQNDQYTART